MVPTLFARRYLRGRPPAIERLVGAAVLTIAVLLVGVFLLTGGLLRGVVDRHRALAAMKRALGISEKPLFLAAPESLRPPAPPPEVRVAESMFPPRADARQRGGVEVVPVVSGQPRLPDLRTDGDRELIDQCRAFGARWVYRTSYSDVSHPAERARVVATIVDAEEPANAFGLWRAREPAGARRLSLGRGGWEHPSSGRTAFWAGRYYTELAVSPRDGKCPEPLLAAIAGGQLLHGGPFWADAVLPAAQRVEGSLRYVRRSPLGLPELADCWLADYEGRLTLGVMNPTADQQARALHSLGERFSGAASEPAAPESSSGETGDGYASGPQEAGDGGKAPRPAGPRWAEALGPEAQAGRVGDQWVTAFGAGPYLFVAAGPDADAVAALAGAAYRRWSAQTGGAAGVVAGVERPPEGAVEKTGRAQFAEVAGGDVLAPSNIERYTDDLYKKIDGREGQFRAYLFVELRFGRYAHVPTKQGFDVYLYDMAEPANALGIYASERSGRADPLPIGRDGYGSGASVYFWKGRYYVNVLGPAEGGGPELEVARRIATAIAGTISDPGEPFWAEPLLPTEDRLAGSFGYRPTSALGHSFLRGMFLARYESQGRRYEIYVLRADGPDEARRLFARLADETAKWDKVLSRGPGDGGETVVAQSGDVFSVSFCKGRYLGAVIECPDQELAARKAGELRDRLPAGG